MKLLNILKEVSKLNEASVYKVTNSKLEQDKTYYYPSNSTAGRAKAQLLANNSALGKRLRDSGEQTTLTKVDQDFPDMAAAKQWIQDNGGASVSNAGSAANVGIEKTFNLLRTFYNQKSSIIKRMGGTAEPTARERTVKYFVAASDIDKTVLNLKELVRDYNDAKRSQEAGANLDRKEQQLLMLSPEDIETAQKYADNFKKYVDMKNGFKKQATDQSPEQVYYPIQTRLVATIPNPRAASEEEPTDGYDPFADGEEAPETPEVDDSLDFKDLGNFIKNNPGLVSKIAKIDNSREKLDAIEANLNKLTFQQLEGLANIQKDKKVTQAIQNLISKKEEMTMARGRNKNKPRQAAPVSKDIKSIFKDLEDSPEDIDKTSMTVKNSVKETLRESTNLLQDLKKYFTR